MRVSAIRVLVTHGPRAAGADLAQGFCSANSQRGRRRFDDDAASIVSQW